MGNPNKVIMDPLLGALATVPNTDAEGLTFNAPIISSTVPSVPVPGQMWMDETLNIKLAGSTLQVGEEMYTKVINKTGSIIPNGSLIYILGVDSGYPKAVLARADTVLSHNVIAMTTNSVGIDAVVDVTTFGIVHDLKTDVDSEGHAVTAGDIIYLSATVAGGWTNVEPYAPSFSIILGQVLVTDATIGQINISIAINNARDLAVVSKEPTGFDLPENVILNYNPVNQTITITGTNWTAYWRGKAVPAIYNGVVPVAHTNTVGHYYFLYWDGTGINNGFNWTTDSFPGFDKLLIAYVYYTTADKFAIRECHGLMDFRAHEEFHRVVGCFLTSGGVLTAGTYATWPALNLSTNTNANNTFGVDSAVISDEDCPTTIPAWIEGTYTLAYRSGAAGDWVFDTTQTTPFWVNGGTNFIQYNQYTGATWQLADVTEANFINYYSFLVPVTASTISQKYRIVIVPGQTLSTTLTAAQALSSLNLALGNLTTLFTESIPYIKVTWYKRSSTGSAAPVGVTGRCGIVDVAYNNGSSRNSVLASGLSPGNHSLLSGRADLNSHPITAIDSATAGSVIFADATGLTEDNANFFWDNTNKRLGLGIVAPTKRLHQDNGTGTATTHQFTAGTTTGQTATDGLLVGIDATGKAIINQQEALALGISTSGTERINILATGEIGIGGAAYTGAALDLINGTTTLVLGADNNANTRTNNAIKVSRIYTFPYANAATPTTCIYTSNGSAASSINIGGGTGSAYAATALNFYTAANNTTATGTVRLGIASTGVATFSQAVIVSATDYGIQLSGGTTAQRSGSPVAGMVRYNSDTLTLESYQNSVWAPHNYCGTITTAIGANTIFTPPTATLSYTAQLFVSDNSLYAQITVYVVNKNGTWEYTPTIVGDTVGAIAVNAGTGVLTYTAAAIGLVKIKCEFINF